MQLLNQFTALLSSISAFCGYGIGDSNSHIALHENKDTVDFVARNLKT